MSVDENAHPQYQPLLRALGAYLDHEENCRFKIVETPDGLTLILERTDSYPTSQEIHFAFDTLVDRCDKLVRERRLLGSRYRGVWPLSVSGRQDFLRALGYELDDSRARSVLIDELEDGLLLTYSYMDPGQGYQWRKHMIVLTGGQIDTILTAAHSRRHKRGLLKR